MVSGNCMADVFPGFFSNRLITITEAAIMPSTNCKPLGDSAPNKEYPVQYKVDSIKKPGYLQPTVICRDKDAAPRAFRKHPHQKDGAEKVLSSQQPKRTKTKLIGK